MRTPSRVWGTAASVILAGTLAACGGGGDEVTPPEGDDDVAVEPTTEPDETAAPGETATVATAESDHGTILVDGEGRTLYVFGNDEPGVSNCADACAEAWPPLVGEPEAGEGVDEALLGTIEREDGETQVTVNELPLYYFAQDAAPGDTNGQGLNDVWWVVSPEGEPIETATE
jgi:predicted lipoprotein with Yx(FWY)xxD motif